MNRSPPRKAEVFSQIPHPRILTKPLGIRHTESIPANAFCTTMQTKGRAELANVPKNRIPNPTNRAGIRS